MSKTNKKKGNDNLISFSIITLGESGVGKTSIIRRYIYDLYDENFISTIGMSFNYKDITLKNNKKIKLKIIDTGGEEKYRSVSKSYFKNADAVLFVYSIDDQKSFDRIKEWITLFNENHNGKEGIPKILVETKNDLPRKVDENNSIQFAESNGFKFRKTSAHDNYLINELFQDAGELLYENYINNNTENLKQKGIILEDEKKKEKEKHKNGCCELFF